MTVDVDGAVSVQRRSALIAFAAIALSWLALRTTWYAIPSLGEPLETLPTRVGSEGQPPEGSNRAPITGALPQGNYYAVAMRLRSAASTSVSTAEVALCCARSEPGRPRQARYFTLDPHADTHVWLTFNTTDFSRDDTASVGVRADPPGSIVAKREALTTPLESVFWIEKALAALAALLGIVVLALYWRTHAKGVESLALGVSLFALVTCTLPASRTGDPYWNAPTALARRANAPQPLNRPVLRRRD